MYDAIIVGARCAGSPTAMLLARQGFTVLLVDRATFPSDTISTHILWPHGAEILARWGLLGTLAATGAPPICRHMTFDVGPFALGGAIPDANDGMGGFCPRRTVLDSLLVNAAADAGVDIWERFTIDEMRLHTGALDFDRRDYQALDRVGDVVRLVDHVGGTEIRRIAQLRVDQLIEDEEELVGVDGAGIEIVVAVE